MACKISSKFIFCWHILIFSVLFTLYSGILRTVDLLWCVSSYSYKVFPWGDIFMFFNWPFLKISRKYTPQTFCNICKKRRQKYQRVKACIFDCTQWKQDNDRCSAQTQTRKGSPEVVFRFPAFPTGTGPLRRMCTLCYQAQTPVWSESSVDEHNLYFARSAIVE